MLDGAEKNGHGHPLPLVSRYFPYFLLLRKYLNVQVAFQRLQPLMLD